MTPSDEVRKLIGIYLWSPEGRQKTAQALISSLRIQVEYIRKEPFTDRKDAQEILRKALNLIGLMYLHDEVPPSPLPQYARELRELLYDGPRSDRWAILLED